MQVFLEYVPREQHVVIAQSFGYLKSVQSSTVLYESTVTEPGIISDSVQSPSVLYESTVTELRISVVKPAGNLYLVQLGWNIQKILS